MLYLINCEIVKSRYMEKEVSKKEVNHIVEASSEEEAKKKLKEYYAKNDDSYYATYWVNINYCNEVIK
jgi:hypothetical protein